MSLPTTATCKPLRRNISALAGIGSAAVSRQGEMDFGVFARYQQPGLIVDLQLHQQRARRRSDCIVRIDELRAEMHAGTFRHGQRRGHAGLDGGGVVLRHADIDAQPVRIGDREEFRARRRRPR